MGSLRGWAGFVVLVLVAAACGGSLETGGEASGQRLFHPDDWPGAPAAPDELFDPVEDGEELPDGFRQVLNRDAIAPVYVPNFVKGTVVDWPDDELVIGVDLDGEARAYPVGFLNRREIVVDMHRGIPTFVTW